MSSCPGPRLFAPGSSRREFLHVGLVGAMGLTLGDFFRLRAAEAALPVGGIAPKADSIIQIYLPGGMSAQESFDPKPYAPGEYRGPFGSVPTKIPGVHFGEKFPKLAAIADKFAVIRSMSHGEAAHERGTHNMFTGYKPSPAISFPSFGAVVSHELGSQKNLPPYVCIPNVPNTFAGSGYLSNAYGPFGLGSDPAQGAAFKVRDLNLPEGVSPERFERRKGMLATVDSHFKTLEESDALDSMDSFYQHAYSLVSSQQAREAFNLKDEPDSLKDTYGRNEAGLRLLLARRLVSSGVRFASVTYGGWDHHDNIKNGFNNQAPKLDQALAALITDLDQRGLLARTLVIVTSEFGRTPKINPTGGRDHWPRVFNVLMAGGGIKPGLIYGASDPLGGEPADKPVSVEDFAHTLYHLIGINADKRLMSPGNRPIDIVRGGQVLTELLA